MSCMLVAIVLSYACLHIMHCMLSSLLVERVIFSRGSFSLYLVLVVM